MSAPILTSRKNGAYCAAPLSTKDDDGFRWTLRHFGTHLLRSGTHHIKPLRVSAAFAVARNLLQGVFVGAQARLIERPAAPAPQSDEGADRREHRRIPLGELPALSLVRIPSRGAISLVDLSSGGALLDLPFQLQPAARITLELRTSSEQLVVPFHLLRCYVAGLGDGVRYHAAGAFDRSISIPLTTGGAPYVASSDPLLEALRVFRRASEATDLTARGTSFNDLLEWTVSELRRGESADITSTKIKTHLCRLFPSLIIGLTASTMNPETPTFVRFGDLGLWSNAPLSSPDRRFLKATAHMLSLLSAPPALSSGQLNGADSPRAYGLSDVVHTLSDWMTVGR